jgi:hypothetical protein
VAPAAWAAHLLDRLQHGDRAGKGGFMAFRRARPLRHIGREAAGRHMAAAHLGQIDAAFARLEEIRTFRPGDVDMRVDREQATMQRDDVGRDDVIHPGTVDLAHRFVKSTGGY